MATDHLTDDELRDILAGCEGVTPADGWVLIKRGLYWRPNAQGYTGILAQAGIYTDEDSAAYLDEGVTRMRFSEAAEVAKATFIDIERDYWRDLCLRQRETGRAMASELLDARKALAKRRKPKRFKARQDAPQRGVYDPTDAVQED